jgi:hypothetical protein
MLAGTSDLSFSAQLLSDGIMSIQEAASDHDVGKCNLLAVSGTPSDDVNVGAFH